MMRIRGWNWKAQALENRITKVHILDGDKDTYLAANGVQYVNLPVADKWVDGTFIRNKDRLGRKLKVKVEFQQELAGETVSVQLLAHQNNADYTLNEKNRKPVFNFTRSPAAKALGVFDKNHGAAATGVTDDNGNFFAEFDLSPAVGDQYKVIAWDKDDNRVQSVEIRTWRALYYMVLRYAHPQSVPTVQINNQIDTTFLPNFTKWIFAGEVNDPANRCFVSADPTHPTTTNLVRTATQVNCATPSLAAKQYQDLEPYLSRIVLISMCITPAAITTTPVVAPVGTGSGPARIQIRNQADVNQGGILFDLRKGLYHNQGDNESLVGGKPLNPAIPANQYFIKGKATLLRQTAIATVVGRITAAGNARVAVTAAGMNNSPKIFNVPVANGNGTNVVAGNIRNALAMDADVTALYDVGGEFERIILTRKTAAAHDATLNIAINDGTCAGLTAAPNSVNTQAGNASPLGYIGIDIPIQFAAITPVVADAMNRPGGFIEADVQVDNLLLNGLAINPPQNAAITLDVYVLNRFVNGMARLSAPQANGIIIIPAARDFKINPDNGQLNSILHELGHCMGMNANPTEVQIDGHQYHYNYNGDHCSSGLPRTVQNDGPSYQTQANQDAPGLCVMFGFTSNVNPRLAFCVDCERVMKKIDSVPGLF